MEFALAATVTISITTVVEAENLEKAIEIAENRGMMSVPRGIGENINEEWIAEELDGSPENIHIE